MTFDVGQALVVGTNYGWQHVYEVFGVCRNCLKSTVFVLEQSDININDKIDHGYAGLTKLHGSLNLFFRVPRYISIRDTASVAPPQHLPKSIEAAFKEAATCLVTECPNAAAAMFRLCLDLATRPLLPEKNENGLNATIRRTLGLRLPWLFDNHLLPETLRGLSAAIKDDGNDGAHAGSLTMQDAEDIADFAVALLERMFTEPKKLELAQERRTQRRTESRE
jgi:hypothetical protein